MHRSKIPQEFGPEHTGFMDCALGWLGWDPTAGVVQCRWPQGWPGGTTVLTAHIDQSPPTSADATYQEFALGAPAQLASPVVIDTSVPVYEITFPQGSFQALVQVTNAGLNWYVWSNELSQVPVSFGVQDGWQISLVRQTGTLSIPANSYLSTAIDQAL